MRVVSPEQLHVISAAADLMRDNTPENEQVLRHALRAVGENVAVEPRTVRWQIIDDFGVMVTDRVGVADDPPALAASCGPDHNPLHVAMALPSGEPS